jgi:23S rRNA pseudouridine955/2504/2580 synthase
VPSIEAKSATVRQIRVDENAAGQRLDNFLLRTLKGVPKSHVYRVIRSGEVRVNRGRASADTRLAEGDLVRVPPVRVATPDPAAPVAPAREFPILLEDEQLLAIDKPAGVAVHGGSGVSSGVIEQLRRARPQARFLELVHRLDKETSGVLLLAKKRSALTALQEQFRRHGGEAPIRKTYVALVRGPWPANRKVIDLPLVKRAGAEGGERTVEVAPAEAPDARRAITLVRVAESLPGFSLLEVTLKTGRTHQIRVHLAAHGQPIAGDDRYGDFSLNRALARGEVLPGLRFPRMFLHAAALRVAHPATGEPLELNAALPAECEALLDALRHEPALPVPTAAPAPGTATPSRNRPAR